MPLAALRSVLWVSLILTGCAGGWHAGTLHPRYSAHTRHAVDSAEALAELCACSAGRLASVKFVITDFDDTVPGQVHLLDGHFYGMHDEWYWYQLLNGRSLFGERALTEGPGFTSVPQAEAWLRAHGPGELALRVTDDRVYSERFYALALTPDRQLAVGALLRVPARGAEPAHWAFELEYADRPTEAVVAGYFAALARALPADVSEDLEWLTRSPDQERLGAELERRGSPLAARVRGYAELAAPGEVEIYNPGTAVGRLLWGRDQVELAAGADARGVAVVDRLPDTLPPAAAFVSTVPQTPLSHLNTQARNRGIPSAYLGGLGADAELAQLARARAPVLLDVRDDRVVLSALSEAEYVQLSPAPEPRATPVGANAAPDPGGLPYAVGLAGLDAAQLDQVRDAIGDKAAGLALLERVVGSDVPRPLLALTVRGYAEHLRSFEGQLSAMLEQPLFQRSRHVRHLVLEGPEDHRKRFGADHAALTIREVARRGGVLQTLVENGGLRVMLRSRPLPEATRLALQSAVQQAFGGLPAGQGLRFRSSVTSEDVQGFTAAGLYASHTGFLDPGAQLHPRDRERSVERILQRTWASYWTFEAFEARQAAGLDHLRGRMAVVVHPRFDDERELGNGVVTFSLLPPGGAELAVMDVQVQLGALSAIKPPRGNHSLPEVDRVVLPAGARDGLPRVQRVRGSSELPAGQHVLGEAELGQLFARCQQVAKAWLALDAARLAGAVTLAFDFKITRGDWPRMAPDPGASRLVLKQVRALEPAAGPEARSRTELLREAAARGRVLGQVR